MILREFQGYLRHANSEFVCATVRALGRVADAEPEAAPRGIEALLQMLAGTRQACYLQFPHSSRFNLQLRSDAVAEQCVEVLRQLLQQNSSLEAASRAMLQLAKLLVMEQAGVSPTPSAALGLHRPRARAQVVWCIGEFHDMIPKVCTHYYIENEYSTLEPWT